MRFGTLTIIQIREILEYWMWDFLQVISIYTVYIIILLKHLIINLVVRKIFCDKCRFYLNQCFKIFRNTYVSMTVKNFLSSINFAWKCLENYDIIYKRQGRATVQGNLRPLGTISYRIRIFIFQIAVIVCLACMRACYVFFNASVMSEGLHRLYLIS